MRKTENRPFFAEIIAIIVLLSISFIMFLGIVLYHVLLRFKLESKLDLRMIKNIFMTKKKSTDLSKVDDMEVISTYCTQQTERHRETLLLDSDFQEFIDDNH